MNKILDLLLWVVKTMAEKIMGKLPDLLERRKLVLTKISSTYRYSHYVGQNHVREGGEKRIYQADASFTIFNAVGAMRILRELTLHCVVNGIDHPLRLFDNTQNRWQENYQLPAKTVTSFSWQAVPQGHGISMWLGAPGIIPITYSDMICFHFTYLDERNRIRRIDVDTVTAYRLPKEQIRA